jgi:hypothetical protein
VCGSSADGKVERRLLCSNCKHNIVLKCGRGTWDEDDFFLFIYYTLVFLPCCCWRNEWLPSP